MKSLTNERYFVSWNGLITILLTLTSTYRLLGVSFQDKVEEISESFANLTVIMSGMMNKNNDQDLNCTLVVNGDVIIPTDLSAERMLISDGSAVATDIDVIRSIIEDTEGKIQYVRNKLLGNFNLI